MPSNEIFLLIGGAAVVIIGVLVGLWCLHRSWTNAGPKYRAAVVTTTGANNGATESLKELELSGEMETDCGRFQKNTDTVLSQI